MRPNAAPPSVSIRCKHFAICSLSLRVNVSYSLRAALMSDNLGWSKSGANVSINQPPMPRAQSNFEKDGSASNMGSK